MSLFKKIVSKILNQDEQQDDPNVTKLADQQEMLILIINLRNYLRLQVVFLTIVETKQKHYKFLIRLLKLRELRMFFVVMITYRIF